MPSKILTPLIIMTLIIGFTVGQVFLENSSAVETSSDKQIQELQKEITELQNKVTALETEVETAPEKPETKKETANKKQTKTQYAYVKQGNNLVNVRENPGLENKIIAKVYKGHPMQILQEKNRWYQVKLENDKIGWVASWIVDVREE